MMKWKPLLIRKFRANLNFFIFGGICFILGHFLAIFSFVPSQFNQNECAKIGTSSLIDNRNKLSQSDRIVPSVFFVILILSRPNNYDHRRTIRETWLMDEMNDTVHLFAISTGNISDSAKRTLNFEQSKFGDLILFNNFTESYKALTQKVIMSFIYVYNNFKFNYLLKVDDDTYVNLQQLYLELKATSYKQRLYWGFFDGRATPFKSGKWKETKWIICDRYLPYALGGGYIISSDLVTFLSLNSNYFKHYDSEDVSIGTWLAALNLQRVHDTRFDTEYKSRGCSNKYVVTHKQTVIQMIDKFHSLKYTGALCKSEFKVRNSYEYNWNVPPSKCCLRNDSSLP